MHPTSLSDRLRLLQWALPVAITTLAAIYQLGPARYVHINFGEWAYYGLEVVFYGTSGPIVVWLTLQVVRGWVEQKERAEAEVYRLNAELQQRVDERTRELREKNEALAAANVQLQQLDRLKSEFVALVSHELRAPLTNMRGALELMESGCPALTRQGQLPACVAACEIGALFFGDEHEDAVTNSLGEAYRLSELLAVGAAHRHLEELGTEPRVWYLPPCKFSPPEESYPSGGSMDT